MQIKDTDVYKLNYFTYNRAFTGSYGNMRYRPLSPPNSMAVDRLLPTEPLPHLRLFFAQDDSAYFRNFR